MKSKKLRNKVIPTIIANNQLELNSIIKAYKKHFKHFQIDVMDGNFVYNKSNWFNFKLPKDNTYEAHLMVYEPENWISKNYKKFDILIPNFERVKNPKKLIKFVKSKGKKIGFALNPETSIMYIEPYLKDLYCVLILTVKPGKYGANFLPDTLEKINMLRMDYCGNIEVDGHQDKETIKLCKKAGANIFAVGSFLKNSKDLDKDVATLKKIVK